MTDDSRWFRREVQPILNQPRAPRPAARGVERAFSSASYTMGPRRTRLEIDNFRAEHRLRRFITACTDGDSHAGRELRLARVERILDRFAEMVNE